MKNTISEMKTVEGIKSRLDEAEDQISTLEGKIEKKNSQIQQQSKRRLKKNRSGKGIAGQPAM